MYTVKNNNSNEIIIKNSKFITYLFKVNKLEDVSKYLEEIKKKHKDATHCCYAYKIDNLIKYTDDSEPNGTAGKPILDVILKKDLNKVLIIVVRYFGGIKLGAGPLLRAYSKSSSSVITKDNIIGDIKYNSIKLEIPYEKKKIIDALLKKEALKLPFSYVFNMFIIYIVLSTIIYELCIPQISIKFWEE